MRAILPMAPFVGFLALLACQDNDPVANDAVAPSDAVVGDASASGLGAPANAATAEAVDRSALPDATTGLDWFRTERGVAYGPSPATPMLTVACERPGELLVTRHAAAPANGKATLSLTGGGHAASMPVHSAVGSATVADRIWQGSAAGDIARDVSKPLLAGGPVQVTLGGAPSIVVREGPLLRDLLSACLRSI